jgi:arylsulfatase A-like enzyme|tara:strand:- start:3 stop:2321 length:2319 start_codon:yes stop_codon:yes gene_type:complete
MRKFFLLTAVIEILAGLVLFFAAEKIPEFNSASPLTIGFAKMYGVAAFSLGLFALYSWKFFDFKKLHIPFLIIFSIFNTGIAFAVIQSNLNFGFENPVPGFFHLILGLIGTYFIFKKKLKISLNKNFFYFFLFIITGILTTKYTLFALPTLISSDSFIRVVILFLIFIFPGLFYLNKIATKKLTSSIKRILFITLTGSVLAWIIQLIEIHLYHFEINVESPIGLFEDEFIRTIKFIFPTLIIAEVIWLYLKNKTKLLYGGITLIIAFSFILFYNSFLFSDSNPAIYPDLSLKNTDHTNVILIVADDLGYADISYNGNKLIQTTNIDEIAKNGINFSRAYATASVCAPSRAAFLTGNYQQRNGFEFLPDLFNYSPRVRKADFKRFGHIDNFKEWYEKDVPINQRGLDPLVNTIADYLKKMGYQTSVIGKWHMGTHSRFSPTNYGFDYHYGITGAGSLYAPLNQENIVESRHTWDFADFITWQVTNYHTLENGKNIIPKNSEYLTDVFTKKAVNYIKANKEKPFFLHLSHMAPHGPFQAQKKYYEMFSQIKDHNKRVYYAMIKNLDDSIGEIKKTLEEEGILNNTLIIFTSDNGGATYTRATNNSPYNGGKMSNFEGGTVVPMMIQWNDKIKPQKNYNHMVSLLDIVPTILDAVDSPSLENNYDGVSLIPFLDNYKDKPHKELFWKTGYVKSIISDNFKLHINEKENFKTLINLENDPFEKFNLISKYPEKVKKLTKSWEQWNNTLKEPKWESNADVSIPVDNSVNSKRYYFPW